LDISEGCCRSLIESTDDSIYVVDRDCGYLFINRAHQERMDIASGGYGGRGYAEFHSQEDARWFQDSIREVFASGLPRSHEYQRSQDGSVFLQTFSPIRSAANKVFAVSVISKNITALKCLQDRLRALSITDELTGLYNRRGFFVLAEHRLKVTERLKNGAYLLYADLDKREKSHD
jgi:PAS domain S-box-containing protein